VTPAIMVSSTDAADLSYPTKKGPSVEVDGDQENNYDLAGTYSGIGQVEELTHDEAADAAIRAIEKEYTIDSDNSPFPEVRANVPNTDDSSLPVNTIRMWFLGCAFALVSDTCWRIRLVAECIKGWLRHQLVLLATLSFSHDYIACHSIASILSRGIACESLACQDSSHIRPRCHAQSRPHIQYQGAYCGDHHVKLELRHLLGQWTYCNFKV